MPWTRDKTKTLRWALLLSLPVLAALPVYFLRDHVAEHTRSWRSAHNLSKARALGEENEWEESYRYALVARQLNPTSVEALRVLVEAALRARSPRTLDFASALFFNANASSDDKLLVLSILQKARDHIGFVRLYNLLPNELRTEPKFVVLRVQFLIDRRCV